MKLILVEGRKEEKDVDPSIRPFFAVQCESSLVQSDPMSISESECRKSKYDESKRGRVR